MKININNYEAFLLDFQEGNLDEIQAIQLKHFMDSHPEFGGFDDLADGMPILEAKPIVFNGKKALLKPEIIKVGKIDEFNYIDHFIAYQEGLLSNTERQIADAFLKENPSLEKDFKLFGMTKLKPNKEITFENKASLYKKTITFSVFSKVASVAAAAALFISLGHFFYQDAKPKTDKVELTASITPILPGKIVNETPSDIIEKTYLPQYIQQENAKPMQETKKQSAKISQRQNAELMASLDKKVLEEIKLSDEAEFYLGSSPERTFYIINNDYMIASPNQKQYFSFQENKDETMFVNIVNKAVKFVSKGEYVSTQDILQKNLSILPKKMIHDVAKASISAFYSLTNNNIFFEKIENTEISMRKNK
jgi:hypothetical protein